VWIGEAHGCQDVSFAMKWAVRGDGGDELRQCRRKAVMIKTEPANSYYGLVRELGKATINICTSFILQNNVFDL